MLKQTLQITIILISLVILSLIFRASDYSGPELSDEVLQVKDPIC